MRKEVGASAPRVCRRCLRASAALFAGEDAEVTARAEARARLEAWERQARASAKHQASGPEISSIPDALDDPADVSDTPFLVSAAWLKRWRAWRRGPPPCLTKEGPTFSVTCVHGALKPNANVARVDRETWSFLVQNPPAARETPKTPTPRSSSTPTPRLASGAGPRGRSRRGGGGAPEAGAGGGGAADLLESDTVFASNAETPAVDVEITGDTDRHAARFTAAAAAPAGEGPDFLEPESSPARWPVHLASAEACAACVSFRIEAAAAKSSTRELAEIHRAACAALRDPWTRRGARRGRRRRRENGTKKNETETSAPFRALPRRWLARWRAFAFAKGAKRRAPGAPGGASTAWRPSLSSLRGATEELFCPHGGLAAPGDLYRPRRSDENGVADDDDASGAGRGRRARCAPFGDGPPRTNERTTTHDKKRTTTGDDRDILPVSSRLELELVPAAAAAALEAALGRARPRAGVLPVGPRGLGRSRRRRARRARAPPSVRHRRRS